MICRETRLEVAHDDDWEKIIGKTFNFLRGIVMECGEYKEFGSFDEINLVFKKNDKEVSKILHYVTTFENE